MSDKIMKTFNGYEIYDEVARTKAEAITDYIVAQGTSGDWTYAKYNSGRAVMTCTVALSDLAASTSFGGVYKSSAQKATLPFTLASEDYIVNVNLGSTTNAFANGCAYTTSQIAYYIVSSANTLTSDAHIYVEGRWE